MFVVFGFRNSNLSLYIRFTSLESADLMMKLSLSFATGQIKLEGIRVMGSKVK